MNNHRLEGGGFKGCQLEIDCRREEARHPGSLCTPLPSRPLCFLNSPPDILGPRSAGPKTSSSGEQTPEGVLGSLFLLATARSYSGPGVVGRIRTRGRGRVQPYPRLCAAHVPSRSDESDRAHEPLLDRSKPFYDISVSKRCALLGPFSCALRACSDARDHNTTIFSSPKGEGFRPSPEETLNRFRRRRSVTQRAVGSEATELLPLPFDQLCSAKSRSSGTRSSFLRITTVPRKHHSTGTPLRLLALSYRRVCPRG